MTIESQKQSLPKVIFFDAVGTLFGIRCSVGDIYCQIAHKYGVAASPDSLNQAFGKTFSRMTPLAFGAIDSTTISQQEYQWWYKVVKATFTELALFSEFTHFDLFFQDLYVYFGTKEAWYLYPETVICLQKWQQRDISLGIISNFDTRIYSVLELLEIKTYFDSITISSEAGFAKPKPEIFKVALAKHNCLPSQAWHIGDSFSDDYLGGKSAGIQAFFLTRDKIDTQVENQLPNLNSLG